ncbi:MAG: GTPase HflX [Myxococcales bacterium]|nr:GTPase HflX [Myxococcales bacterium]
MRIHSKPIEEHEEVPLADDGRWEELVEDWDQREGREPPADGVNASFVVSITTPQSGADPQGALAEILGLVEAQGDRVVGSTLHSLTKPDPRTLLRSGVADRIASEAREAGANLLVVDAELTPSQTRNLEEACGLSICDREAVILNVFQRHAKSRRSRVQVEIAHLEYLRPRIRGVGLNMDQQAGGVMRGRGPGETASELLARQLDGRLADLRGVLAKLKQSAGAQRKSREQCARIALVGYTNAGKTSLMNGLTEAGLSARDRPFETLETTSRSLARHGGDIIISDTVGFIRRLPDRLFASFESTLAELCEATLLLLVVDVSDAECALHLETTEAQLGRLSAEEIPRFYVFNKTDRLPEPLPDSQLAEWAGGHPYRALSTKDADAVAQLRDEVLAAARSDLRTRTVYVPYRATGVSQTIYAQCRVLDATPTREGMQFTIEGKPHLVEQIVRESREAQRD